MKGIMKAGGGINDEKVDNLQAHELRPVELGAELR